MTHLTDNIVNHRSSSLGTNLRYCIVFHRLSPLSFIFFHLHFSNISKETTITSFYGPGCKKAPGPYRQQMALSYLGNRINAISARTIIKRQSLPPNDQNHICYFHFLVHNELIITAIELCYAA